MKGFSFATIKSPIKMEDLIKMLYFSKILLSAASSKSKMILPSISNVGVICEPLPQERTCLAAVKLVVISTSV